MYFRVGCLKHDTSFESEIHMTNNEMYFRVNEVSESLNAISMFKTFLVQCKENQYYLKWAIIAAHNSLQAFMVLALEGTSSLQIIKWNDKKYRDKTHYEILSDPDKKLDNFLYLFDKIKSSEYMQNGKYIDEDGRVTDLVGDLNEIRNKFIHYLPCSWALSIQLVNQILAAVINVISYLAQNSTEVIRNFNEQELDYINEQLDECSSLINKIN
jgi:hypothetical protein